MIRFLKDKSWFSKITAWFLVFSLLGCASGGFVKAPEDPELNAEAAKAYAELKSKSKISTHPKWNAMLKRVTNRIAKASGEDFQWEYVLIENPDVNAWCMPGGKIAVYTGIMPVLKTEGALAAVLGHEVAHATRRHGKQQYARSMNTNLLGLIVGGIIALGGQALCKTNECKLLTGIGGAAAGFAATFFTLKFSREDETDADYYGQQYMAKAGYDPSESISLWQRMSESHQGQALPEILSTHPSDESRQERLRATLGETKKIYASSKKKHGLGERIR
jgi:predicted Zn-dependent protease